MMRRPPRSPVFPCTTLFRSLPGLDGWEVARRIREREGGSPVLLVALTGHGREQDQARSREAGFDHHLTKPADPRSEEHTSELQSRQYLVCRLLLEKKHSLAA